jgi:hypothetical protein
MLRNKDEILHQLEGLPSFEEVRKYAKESVPEQYRNLIKDIYDNPMGFYVCSSLFRTSINSKFGYDKIAKAAAKAPNANLSELPKILEDMEAKGIIVVEQREGKPDYALTPTSAEVMETIRIIEKESVRPIARSLVEVNPELKLPKEEVEKIVRSIVYSTLT